MAEGTDTDKEKGDPDYCGDSGCDGTNTKQRSNENLKEDSSDIQRINRKFAPVTFDQNGSNEILSDSTTTTEEDDEEKHNLGGHAGSTSDLDSTCEQNGKVWSVSSSISEIGGEVSSPIMITSASAVVTNDNTSDTTRRHSKSQSLPHGVKLCPEKTSESPIPNVEDASGTEQKWVNLEEELRKAQIELKAKDDEVEKLKGIRQQVEAELDDLTASLFVEAHKMVKEAKMKEISSEKNLKETKMQLDGLQAEVSALKALLITSTPSRPNLGGSNGISLFKKQHKRTPSHNHLQYGRAEDETDGDGKEKDKHKSTEVIIDRDNCEMDPLFHKLFSDWRSDPTLNKEKTPFLQKLYDEDIEPCLSFVNIELVKKLRTAVEENSIWVEPLPEKEKSRVPKNCALLGVPRVCNYRMRFAFDSDEWFDISQLCRDRIAAVCESLNYLRYIKNGLVKASVDGAYWEIIRLRKQMALAKLGVSIS